MRKFWEDTGTYFLRVPHVYEVVDRNQEWRAIDICECAKVVIVAKVGS
jgi:hypothetical protein